LFSIDFFIEKELVYFCFRTLNFYYLMNFFCKALNLYVDGFRNFPETSKKDGLITLIKLFTRFIILKLFFIPNIQGRDFSSYGEGKNHTIKELTNP